MTEKTRLNLSLDQETIRQLAELQDAMRAASLSETVRRIVEDRYAADFE